MTISKKATKGILGVMIALAAAIIASVVMAAQTTGPTGNSGHQLPFQYQKELQMAVGEKGFGNFLTTSLDMSVAYTIATSAVSGTQQRYVIQAWDTARLRGFGDNVTLTASGTTLPAIYPTHLMSTQIMISCFLSDDSLGRTVSGTALTSAAIGTNGGWIPFTSSFEWDLITNSAGTVTLYLTQNSAHTYYLACVLPNGKLVVSASANF